MLNSIKKILLSIYFSILFTGCNTAIPPNNIFYYYRGETAAIPIIKKLMNSTVDVYGEFGAGTGVIIKKENNELYVLTCSHIFVFEDADGKQLESPIDKTEPFILSPTSNPSISRIVKISVSRWIDGKKKTITKNAKIISLDTINDLCILKVPNFEDFTTEVVEMYKENSPPPIGTEIYHVGNFLGKYSYSVSKGLIAHNSRGHMGEKYQCDINVSFGSSGGGVFDTNSGKYIGMIISIYPSIHGVMVTSSKQILRWAELFSAEKYFQK